MAEDAFDLYAGRTNEPGGEDKYLLGDEDDLRWEERWHRDKKY